MASALLFVVGSLTRRRSWSRNDASAALVLQPVALARDLHHRRVAQDAVEHGSVRTTSPANASSQLPNAKFEVRIISQRLKRPPVSRAREQLIAVDQIEQGYRLFAQGMDDVPVVDHLAALALRHRLAAPECDDVRRAEEAFEPIIVDAHPQTVADEARGHSAEYAPEDEAPDEVTVTIFSSKPAVRRLGS